MTASRVVFGGSPALADEPCRTASSDQGESGVTASARPGRLTELPSIESVVIDERRRIVYTGVSMNPTLREPDLLQVEPYGNEPVRTGDVVCFKSPGGNTNIVHRVISIDPACIRTRGDNNSQPDPWFLEAEYLMGRVVAAQRGQRRRLIRGGRTGRIIAWSVRLRRAVWRVFAGVVSGVYQGLARSGPFDFLLPGGLRPRLFCFKGREAATLKLMAGRLEIGRYDRERLEWQIRRPFRLFLNEQSLTKAVSLASRKELLG
jgi:hypothetical protein